MPQIQFHVNVANGVAIDGASIVLPVWWRYTLSVLTNQNHCYMPKLNDCEIYHFRFSYKFDLSSFV